MQELKAERPKVAAVYVRVSTDDKGQDPELQLGDCSQLAISKGFQAVVFRDELSAFKDSVVRPGFEDMVKRVALGEFGAIIVWDLDRLYRNRIKAVSLVKELSRKNVKLFSSRQRWLENIAEIPYPWNEIVGDLLLNIVAWMAEEESQKRSDRVHLSIKKKDGITMSKDGNKWGRRPLPKQTRDRIIELHRQGKGIREIARTVKYYQDDKERRVSVGAVHKIIRENSRKKGGVS